MESASEESLKHRHAFRTTIRNNQGCFEPGVLEFEGLGNFRIPPKTIDVKGISDEF
jgi:hypothetical protein